MIINFKNTLKKLILLVSVFFLTIKTNQIYAIENNNIEKNDSDELNQENEKKDNKSKKNKDNIEDKEKNKSDKNIKDDKENNYQEDDKKKKNDDDYQEPQPDPENDDIDQKVNKSINFKKKKPFNYNKSIKYLNQENIQKTDLNEIKEVFKKNILKKETDLSEYHYGLVNAKLALKNLELGADSENFYIEALSSFRKAYKLTNDIELKNIIKTNKDELYKSYIDRGIKYFKKGYYKRAKDNFLIAERIKENFPKTYLYFASISIVNKKYEEALEELTTYHKLGGIDLPSYYAKALVFDALKQYQNAVSILNNGLKLYPYSDSLLYRKYNILKKTNYLNDYDKNIKRSDISKGAKYYQLAIYHKYLNNLEESVKFTKKATKYSPKVFETQFNLGLYYYNKASEIFNKSIDEKIKKNKKIKNTKSKQITKYLKLAKKNFLIANQLKHNQKLIIEKIKFIEKYLQNEKQKNKRKK